MTTQRVRKNRAYVGPDEAVSQLMGLLSQLHPQVVITFGPDGGPNRGITPRNVIYV